MLRYAAGDVAAFEELYSRHKDRLYRYLCRSTGNEALAEEAAQEAWTSVIRSAADWQPKAAFSTWLYTIARRKLIDQQRRYSERHEQAVDGDEIADEQQLTGETAYQLQQFARALESLPDEQREVFVLKEEGFSLAEIADVVEAGQETVKSRLRYARSSLRAGLEDRREA